MRPAQFASRPKVNVIATVVIFAVALMFVFPVYWMISTSFKQSLDILTPGRRYCSRRRSKTTYYWRTANSGDTLSTV